MDTRYNSLMGAVFLTVMLVRVSTANVIIGDAVLGVDPYDPDGYQLTLSQSIEGPGLFSILISNNGGGSYSFSYGGIAEEYGLYSAFSGLEFVPAYAISQTPIVSNNGVDPGTSVQNFSLNQTKYFAYWDNVGSSESPSPDNYDHYGWISLTYTASGLLLTDGATAMGGGIIVGTYTQVPEPATALLFGLGGFGAWFYRRRKTAYWVFRLK